MCCDCGLGRLNWRLVAAVEGGTPSEVATVLEEAGDKVQDVVNAQCGYLRVTALHLAVARGPGPGEAVVRVLLDHGAHPSAADKLGRSPLHLAAQAGCTRVLDWLLEAGAQPDPRFRVSKDEVDEGRGGQGCSHGPVGGQLALPECWGRTPLHLAAKAGNPQCVRLLLGAGADPNACDEKGFTPILLVGNGMDPEDEEAISRFEDVVIALLEAGADANARSKSGGGCALLTAATLQSEVACRHLLAAGASAAGLPGTDTPLHAAAASGSVPVVRALLERGPPYIVNARDQVGRTPLHTAACMGARQTLDMLVRHGGDLSAETNDGVSVVDAVFTCIPRPVHFLTELLDACIVTNSASINDKTFKVDLDFRVLAPGGPMRQMSVLMAAISACSQTNLNMLLQHPLVRAFLWFKWRKLRIFFFALLLVNTFFVLSLSAHAVLRACGKHSTYNVKVSRRLLFVSSIALLVYVAGLVLVVPRRTLTQFETWLNMASISLALCVCVWGEACDTGAVLTHADWTRHVFSALVLLAWTELMLLVGRFPTWGCYALMFYNVLKNVIKVMLTFVCLVIGFAFSFLIQFQENYQFETLWLSLIKTTVMMTGEFDYGDLFTASNITAPNITASNSNRTYKGTEMSRLPVTSHIIFLLFVILASIVLMNLMVGLAVSDIQALQLEGIVHRLLKQAAFIEQLEKIGERILQIRFIPRCVRLMLDLKRSINTQVVIEPSSNSHSSYRLPFAILEAVTLAGLRNHQQQEELTLAANCYSHKPANGSEVFAGIEDTGLANMLDNIQRELSEIHQLISALHGVQHQSSSLPVVSRKVSNRFSHAVSTIHDVQGVLCSIRQGRKNSRPASRI